MKLSSAVLKVTLAVFYVLIVSGCQPTLVDQFYGTSYELAKVSQIANPEAGIESGPPIGLEGEIGARVIERYKESFESQAMETTTYTLSVEGVEM